jgi:hypothetical protein
MDKTSVRSCRSQPGRTRRRRPSARKMSIGVGRFGGVGASMTVTGRKAGSVGVGEEAGDVAVWRSRSAMVRRQEWKECSGRL